MTEQTGEKVHHRLRHAGHLDDKAEEHEQRHGDEHDMAHAFVHPSNQNRQRLGRRQGQIAKGREREGEHDRHAAQDTKGDDADKEDQEIEIAERLEMRADQPKPQRARRDQRDGADSMTRRRARRQPDQ